MNTYFPRAWSLSGLPSTASMWRQNLNAQEVPLIMIMMIMIAIMIMMMTMIMMIMIMMIMIMIVHVPEFECARGLCLIEEICHFDVS